MGVVGLTSPVLDALARFETAQHELFAVSLDCCTDEEILEVLRRVEVSRRRQAVLDQRLIDQVRTRGIAVRNGCATVLGFLRLLLRITPGEASARLRAAKLLGPQHTVAGEPLEAVYPGVCAAQADGSISVQHAQVILDTITKLPAQVAAAVGGTVEAILVGYARDNDPRMLKRHADQLAYALDQDGQYRDAIYRDTRRDLTLRDNPDGSGHLDADLTAETAECAERLRVVFDALAKPAAAVDGIPDLRSPGQRRHDAFLGWLKLVERARLLPDTGGIAATLLLTMDADTFCSLPAPVTPPVRALVRALVRARPGPGTATPSPPTSRSGGPNRKPGSWPCCCPRRRASRRTARCTGSLLSSSGSRWGPETAAAASCTATVRSPGPMRIT